MSGTPTPDEGGTGWDVIAGEYVLGLLDEAAAETLRQRARTTPALAASIAAWEQRLDPLADVAEPAAPSDALWKSISAGIRPKPAPAPVARHSPWRGVAIASMALAAGLAAFIVYSADQPAPSPWAQAVSLLSVPGTAAPALRAQVTRAGLITVVPLKHLEVAAGQALGFWAWPASEKAPVFLGMISPDGGQLRFPFPAREGTPVMVTLEHAGATCVSAPGPTLYLGLLVAAQS
jgi:anti-sigma-K factor RskA